MATMHDAICTCGISGEHLHDTRTVQGKPCLMAEARLGWSALPLPVWEVVADSLMPEDILAARLVCRQWAQDFGALVDYAIVLPVQLAAASKQRRQRRSAANSIGNDSSSSTNSISTSTSTSSGCRALCAAFPYIEVAYVDVSSKAAQELAGKAMASIVAKSKAKDLVLELDALPRCYHCHHKSEAPTLQGELPFADIPAMARRLTAPVLDRICALYLDCFPEQPEQWQELSALPALKCLSLPLFKPSLRYEHVPHIAKLTQLDALTLSVQGSFMDWPATSAAFRSLSALTGLTSLTLHAFHCCSSSLSDAVWQLQQLRTLSVSGRVVLSPVTQLAELAGLQHLDMTQDIKDVDLIHLTSSLTALTHLQSGKLLPPPPEPPAADPAAAAAGPQAPAAAAGAAAAGLGAAAGVGAAGAAAAGGGAGAAGAGDGQGAAAGNGNGGGAAAIQGLLPQANDNIMDDLGAIVDGLIQNMQPGVMPEHLQRVIERFEMLMQLDLTRHSSGGTFSAPPCADYALPSPTTDAPTSTNPSLSSLELSLHKVTDLHTLYALQPLPQLRALRHLALRLRDNLLGGAGAPPCVLEPCHALRLGGFGSLRSLCLSGKLALGDGFLVPLLRGLCGLRALSLDAHLRLGREGRGALAQLTALQALTLKHRGSGKATLYLTHLPHSLTALTLKRCCVLVGPEVPRSEPSSPTSSKGEADRVFGQPQLRRQHSGPLTNAAGSFSGAGASSSNGSGSGGSSSSGLGRRRWSDVSVDVPPAATPSTPGPSHPIASPSFTRAVCAPSCSLAAKRAAQASARRPKLGATCLPQLQSLLLHSCLVEGAFVGTVAKFSTQLTQLGVTGESNGEAFELWANVLPRLRAIQVLDLSVPEVLGPRPLALRDLLLSMPRLVHLHLAMLGGAAAKQLVLLGALTQLRTLAVDYCGPPQLPSSLKDSLQAALPCCKVQVWEQLQLVHEAGSWADANGCLSAQRRRFGPPKWAWAVSAVALLAGVVVGAMRRRSGVMRSLRVRRDLKAVAGCGAVLAVALQG